jgi:excisionase family DNA binding protein
MVSTPSSNDRQESGLTAAEESRIRELIQTELEKHLVSSSITSLQPLWDVDQVAQYLHVSRRTVETLIAAGELRPMRVGRQRRFDPKTIDAYLRSTIE